MATDYILFIHGVNTHEKVPDHDDVMPIRDAIYGISGKNGNPLQGIQVASFHTMGSPVAIFSLMDVSPGVVDRLGKLHVGQEGAGKGDKSILETGFRTLLTTSKSWFSFAAKYLTFFIRFRFVVGNAKMIETAINHLAHKFGQMVEIIRSALALASLLLLREDSLTLTPLASSRGTRPTQWLTSPQIRQSQQAFNSGY